MPTLDASRAAIPAVAIALCCVSVLREQLSFGALTTQKFIGFVSLPGQKSRPQASSLLHRIESCDTGEIEFPSSDPFSRSHRHHEFYAEPVETPITPVIGQSVSWMRARSFRASSSPATEWSHSAHLSSLSGLIQLCYAGKRPV